MTSSVWLKWMQRRVSNNMTLFIPECYKGQVGQRTNINKVFNPDRPALSTLATKNILFAELLQDTLLTSREFYTNNVIDKLITIHKVINYWVAMFNLWLSWNAVLSVNASLNCWYCWLVDQTQFLTQETTLRTAHLWYPEPETEDSSRSQSIIRVSESQPQSFEVGPTHYTKHKVEILTNKLNFVGWKRINK